MFYLLQTNKLINLLYRLSSKLRESSIIIKILILLFFIIFISGFDKIETLKNTLEPGGTLICKNTPNGSPSFVIVYNNSNEIANVVFILGMKSYEALILPKETIQFPKNSPDNFNGLVLRISNVSFSSKSNVYVYFFSLGDC